MLDAATKRGRSGKKAKSKLQGSAAFFVYAIEAAAAAAVAGLGILSTGQRSVQRELASRDLVRVLPHWAMGSGYISVILPAGRSAKPSARAFANFAAG
ncbi:LysR family transcriptional regulator [Mesorhizobium sp. B2-3-5]|nr:LysR family transcriptional regulator [Mesorhizobium sp. B2-3-5]